jgi:hypothetical protein
MEFYPIIVAKIVKKSAEIKTTQNTHTTKCRPPPCSTPVVPCAARSSKNAAFWSSTLSSSMAPSATPVRVKQAAGAFVTVNPSSSGDNGGADNLPALE